MLKLLRKLLKRIRSNMTWAKAMSDMDRALFNEFGDSAVIAGKPVQVITADALDSFGSMGGNVTTLLVSHEDGVSFRKGDAVAYMGRDRTIATIPDRADGMISFELT